LYNRRQPIGWWKFDERSGITVYDSSINGNNGTLTNMDNTDWVAGKINTALDFDGTDDYSQVSSTSQIDYNENFTIELWAYPRSFTNPNSNCIGDYRSYLTSQTYSNAFHTIKIITTNANDFEFWVRDTTIKSVSTGALSVNQWYHLVGVRSGNSIIFYKNGVSMGTADVTGLSFADISDNTFWIGAGDTYSCSNNNFNGLIDDVRIYNYARTVAEIKADYNNGATYFK